MAEIRRKTRWWQYLVPLGQEFTNLVTSFAEQIDLALKRVDKVTPEALEKISVQMKAPIWVL